MKKVNVKKVLKGIAEGFLAILFVSVVFIFIITKVSGKPFFVFGRSVMFVMTESMEPTIEARTYVLVEKVKAEDVEVGDVVVFYSTNPQIEGQLNTHRVIEKNGNAFVTKGDNNVVDDGQYSAKAEYIVARYIRNMPVMTFLGRLVLQPFGFMALMLILMIFIAITVAGDIKNFVNGKKEDEDEKKEKEAEKQKLFERELERLKREGLTDAERSKFDDRSSDE